MPATSVAVPSVQHVQGVSSALLFTVSSTWAAPQDGAAGGGAAAAPQPQQQQCRRRADAFEALHGALAAELGAAAVRGLSLPSQSLAGWLVGALFTPREAAAEQQRAALQAYLQAALALPGAPASAALANFLSPHHFTDWPAPTGPLSLALHDPPHDSSATEWWYFNTHFRDAAGNEYSAFAAFFRVVKHTDPATGVRSYAHALNWALTDVKNKRYVHESVLDKDSPEVVKKQLASGIVKDPRLKRAYMEILDKGNVPLPDRMFKREPRVRLDALALDFESASLRKTEEGAYHLKCSVPGGGTAVDLLLTPQRQPVRHGLNGVVKGHDGDDMFYYCIPRCSLSGSVTVDGRASVLSSGQGWYDHEFGGVTQEETGSPGMQYAWNWAAIQLDDGTDVSVATLVDPRSAPFKTMESRSIVIDARSQRTQPEDLTFEPLAGVPEWTSVRTFNSYPTAWRVSLPSAGLELQLRAAFEDQEFVTLIAKPGFWEGRLSVTGTHHGRPVAGLAYIERNGFSTLSELDTFFKAVGAETRRAVREVYPDVVTREVAVNLIATPETAHYVEGVDFDVFKRGIIDPVRYISDAGGKSWRSYGALACMDVVGGDSRKFVRWLSMPEFMHVGSLIVDDIEDVSELRRGKPCAHKVFGEPIAINAGTAAYFQGQQMLLVPGLSAEKLNKVYDYYFSALRAGHAGQALDISGLDYLMDATIEAGTPEAFARAESRIIAVHRLKTAVPAASLARMGALVGGGSEEQIEAVGLYYESVGIAFQIMDDVLNLRGLYAGKADKAGAGSKDTLKTLGEDIMAGKVTIPVVKAMRRLPQAEMRALWQVIRTKPQERAVVDGVIAQLEACGAVQECVEQSEALVNDAFKRLDNVIPDSFSKLMLRSFGFFVTVRGSRGGGRPLPRARPARPGNPLTPHPALFAVLFCPLLSSPSCRSNPCSARQRCRRRAPKPRRDGWGGRWTYAAPGTAF
jgi:geranylgeranyl pyrophosphate synthase/predicted secreted hydrolase